MDNEEGLRIVEVLSKTKTNESQFSFNKDKFKLEMLQIIDSLRNSQELDIAKKMLAPLQPTLTAFRSSKTTLCEKLDEKVPHNKNINQQRRLYKTKKTSTSRKKVQLSKPDGREANEVAFNLLCNP